MQRKICVITGTRADYGILTALLRAIRKEPRLKLQLLVCGMHLLKRFGHTIAQIRADGFDADAEVQNMNEEEETPYERTLSISRGVEGMAAEFRRLKPDIVLVLGDRIEMLTAAITATYMSIPLAHLHGGDNATGGLDEYARGAITKLAQIHFPVSKKSEARLLRMGEAKWRIFRAGSPAVDFILSQKLDSKDSICRKYGLEPKKPFLLVLQHPLSTSPDAAASQMGLTLSVLESLRLPAVLIYPNSDAGGRQMIEVIEQRRKRLPLVRICPSVPYADYLSLMKHCGAMVGNTSSAILEAPSFCTPAVNIGPRQAGREQGGNVLSVGHERKAIESAVKKALSPSFRKSLTARCASPYGDGHASERIVKVLCDIPLDAKLFQKQMMDE